MPVRHAIYNLRDDLFQRVFDRSVAAARLLDMPVERRRFHRLVEAARHAFELRVLLDRERAIENLAVHHSRALQFDGVAVDRALEVAVDDGVLGHYLTFHLRAFADCKLAGMNLAADLAVDLQSAGTDDVAGDHHAMAEGRDHVALDRSGGS